MQGFIQGTDDLHDDDQSSTTWYDSAAHETGSARSRSSFLTAQADSIIAELEDADEFASVHSTGSFVSAAGSFVSASGSFQSNASYRTTHSQQSGTSLTSGAAAAAAPAAAAESASGVSGGRVGAQQAVHAAEGGAPGSDSGGAEVVLQSALYWRQRSGELA